MTYEEAMEPGNVVPKPYAVNELANHGLVLPEDIDEALDYAAVPTGLYSTAKLLVWLGY